MEKLLQSWLHFDVRAVEGPAAERKAAALLSHLCYFILYYVSCPQYLWPVHNEYNFPGFSLLSWTPRQKTQRSCLNLRVPAPPSVWRLVQNPPFPTPIITVIIITIIIIPVIVQLNVGHKSPQFHIKTHKYCYFFFRDSIATEYVFSLFAALFKFYW